MGEIEGGPQVTCGDIQDRLPERATGRMAEAEVVAVDRHLAACEECREVFETVRLLGPTRPVVPAGLEDRILAALGTEAPEETRPPHRWWIPGPGWGLAAAAVLALAIGLPVFAPSEPEEAVETAALALADEGVGEVWLDDDLMVAGAPALSELSDEALQALLQEFER